MKPSVETKSNHSMERLSHDICTLLLQASKQRIVTGANDGAVGRRWLAFTTPLEALPTRLNGGKETSSNNSNTTLETSEAGHNDGFGGAENEKYDVDDGCAVKMHPQCGADDEWDVPAACMG